MKEKKQNMPPMGPPGRGRGPVMREKPKNAGKTLKRLVNYIADNKHIFFLLLADMIAVTLLNLAIPSMQGFAIDAITINENRLQLDLDLFGKMLVVLVLLYIVLSLFSYLQGIFSAKLSQMTVRSMRSDLFSKIVRLQIRYFDTHQHGDIMSRMTNDVENISNTISQSIGSLISGVLTVIGTVAIMLWYSPLLTAISMVTILLTMTATALLTKPMRKLFSQQQRLLGKLNGHAEETITGYKTIAAFGKGEAMEAEFNEISGELCKCATKAQIIGGSMGPVMNFISNFGFLLIATAGGMLAVRGAITIGAIQAFLIYARQFSRPISEIANQFAQIQTAIAGAERVFDIMDAPPEVDEGKTELSVAEIEGNIHFEHIWFSYKQDEPVLKDFDLQVKAGQKIALVGATGSGKTTVVNLLTRFYDVDEGRILLDGVDIRDIPKDDLRRSIAIVLQDTVLFSDTITNNIRYGNLEADTGAVQDAAKTANANLFIERLQEEYETVLTESGGNLSQGQRQLLSIARAVLADPKILVLDEATSSVDTRTEMHIQQAMIALMRNRTSIIIAHRLSTIRDADMIVVLDHGRIAEVGSHETLLEQKGCYYQLYQNQFAGNKT